MKLGVTILPGSGRISPVLESSKHLLILRACRGGISVLSEQSLPDPEEEKCKTLLRSGIRVLICGASANETLAKLQCCGIRVCPFVSGDWREFLKTWLVRPEQAEAYVMPGCRRQHCRCCQGQPNFNDKEERS